MLTRLVCAKQLLLMNFARDTHVCDQCVVTTAPAMWSALSSCIRSAVKTTVFAPAKFQWGSVDDLESSRCGRTNPHMSNRVANFATSAGNGLSWSRHPRSPAGCMACWRSYEISNIFTEVARLTTQRIRLRRGRASAMKSISGLRWCRNSHHFPGSNEAKPFD